MLLQGPNIASTITLWSAVLRIEAVAVTTIALQRAIELEKIVNAAEVQLTAIDHRFTEKWNAVTEFKGKTFIYGDKNDLFALADKKSSTHIACDIASDDVAILAFTSGSTAVPKAIMHFHRDVLAIEDTFAKEILKATLNDLFAGTPPIAFTFGLGGSVLFFHFG